MLYLSSAPLMPQSYCFSRAICEINNVCDSSSLDNCYDLGRQKYLCIQYLFIHRMKFLVLVCILYILSPNDGTDALDLQ